MTRYYLRIGYHNQLVRVTADQAAIWVDHNPFRIWIVLLLSIPEPLVPVPDLYVTLIGAPP